MADSDTGFTTRNWGKLLLISLVIYSFIFIGMPYISDLGYAIGAVDLADIDACLDGRTTPEELGFPDMTCSEISQSYNRYMFTFLFGSLGGCCSGVLCLIGFFGAVMKDGDSSPELVAATEETERLRSQMREMHSNLLRAEQEHREVLDAQRSAQERYRQSASAHATYTDSISRAHADMKSELEEAAARAKGDMMAAKEAVEEAESARVESEAAAQELRAAEKELRRAAGSAAGPASITYNIDHKERVYRDSVHQEDERGDD